MKNKILDPNHPLYVFMRKTVWSFVFNIIFMLTCFPIVTIFPSAVACAGVFLQIADERSKNWLKEYVSLFVKRLKVSFAYGIIMILFVNLMMTEYYWFSSETGAMKYIGFCVGILAIAVVTVFYVGLAHVIARFQYGFRDSFLATWYFIRKNLGMALIGAGFFAALSLGLGVLMWYVPYIAWMVILWFGLAFLATAYPYRTIFNHYLYEDEADFTDEELASFNVLCDRLERLEEEENEDAEEEFGE
ncbi:MAG: DUF624 domain-containing protein [Lachnospiraceae bacterium]|nr:DUF624 domain-containing protein [Lachnospiraceae bacterium]